MSARIVPDSAQRIRIARVITRLVIGGPTLHILNLSTGLDTALFETKVVCGKENAGEDSMLGFVASKGMEPIVIPEMRAELSIKPKDVKAIAKLYGFFRSYRPHIVETHTAKAGFAGRIAARLAGVPVVIHTYHGHILRGYYSPVINHALCRMEQMLGFFSDGLIAVSSQIKKDLLELRVAPEEKIEVVPLGMEFDEFSNSKSLRGELRRELGIEPSTPLVGIVGRIVPIKNHSLFIGAAAKVLIHRPNTRFLIIGDGLGRPALEKLVQDLQISNRVIFTGWRRDLPRIYSDLDVLAISSNNEGTPFCALEAMASGCPVVATQVGGIPDVIQHARTGLLVPPQDPDMLATSIVRLLNNTAEARQLACAAQKDVINRYRVDRLVSDTQRVYESLLRRKNVHVPTTASVLNA